MSPTGQSALQNWFRLTPWRAIAIAIGLVLASIGLALHNEDIAQETQLQQTQVQADVLASSLAASLAFDDRIAAQEYLDAVRANSEIEAAGAYFLDGQLAAGFVRDGAVLPRGNQVGAPVRADARLIVTAPVTQGGTQLGSVYLRAITESPGERALRYVGIGMLIVMAALLLAVLGTSNAALSATNLLLQAEIESRQRAETALHHAQKMEAMGQLTGGVAHDFNNLLTPIIGSLDILQRRVSGEREKRLIASAMEAADRAKTLVQRLLAFARRQPLKLQPVDLSKLIGELDGIIRATCGTRVRVELDLPDRLPLVSADPGQLELAVLNLVVNGCDAIPLDGTVRISVRRTDVAQDSVPGLAGGDYVSVSVRDDGTGMDEPTLARAIEPFFSTKGIGKGTGLGLSMVHGLMQQLGGTMRIDSEVGRGTDILLYVPISHDAPVVAAPQSPVGTRPAVEGRVLLVDDDDFVRTNTVEMLVDAGYKVDAVRSAAAALDFLQSGADVDIVVTDHMMPGMLGSELAVQIRARRPGLPVVLISGYADLSEVHLDIPRLAKPFKSLELTAILSENILNAQAGKT